MKYSRGGGLYESNKVAEANGKYITSSSLSREAWDYLVEGQNYDTASQVLLQWRCCCEVQRSQEHLKSKDSQPYALVQARQVCK